MSGVWEHVLNLWAGGGVVMPTLFLTAFVLWTTLGHRILTLRRGPSGPVRMLLDQASRGQLVGRRGLVGEAVHRAATLRRLLGTRHVPRARLDEALGDLEDALTSGHALSTCLVAMAPLLGLLGTVTGLIETFGSLGTSSASAASEGIAGGIVEALYATQMGLAIAVPGLLMGGMLRHREEQLRTDLAEIKEQVGGALEAP